MDRPVSPASSVGTTYPADQTSFSDLEENCPQHQFEARCRDQLRLSDSPSQLQRRITFNPRYPLLDPIPINSLERQHMFNTHLDNLRSVIKTLEEDHLFEQTKFRGSQVALPDQPQARDIDDILLSMIDLAPQPNDSADTTAPTSTFQPHQPSHIPKTSKGGLHRK